MSSWKRKEWKASPRLFYELCDLAVPPTWWKPGMKGQNPIEFRHLSSFGRQGSGKTESLLSFIFQVILRLRTRFNEADMPSLAFRALLMDDVLDWTDKSGQLPACAFVILGIDDAEKFGFSQRRKDTLDQIFDFNFIRHELQYRGMKRGIVVCYYASQEYFNLYKVFRNSQCLILKALSMMDKRQSDSFRAMISWKGMKMLRTLARYNRGWNPGFKGYSVTQLEGRRYPFYTYFPLAEPEVVDLWSLHKVLHDKDKASHRILAEELILNALEEFDGIPIHRIGRVPYFVIVRDWLKDQGCNLPLTETAKLLGPYVKKVRRKYFQEHGRYKDYVRIPVEDKKKVMAHLSARVRSFKEN